MYLYRHRLHFQTTTMTKLFQLFILTLLIVSCSSRQKERRIVVDDVVDYREVLFEVDDSLPMFKLSTKRQLLDTLKANNYWFDESCGREFKWFNLKLNSKKLKVVAYKHYPPPGTYPREVIEVVVNRKGQLLFERTLISIDDLGSLLYTQLMITEFKFHEYLIFQWDERSSLQVIDSVFNEIENGYTLFYDSIARNKYKSAIHNLKLEQLNEMKMHYPFKVVVLVKRRPFPFEEGDSDSVEIFQGFIYDKSNNSKTSGNSSFTHSVY